MSVPSPECFNNFFAVWQFYNLRLEGSHSAKLVAFKLIKQNSSRCIVNFNMLLLLLFISALSVLNSSLCVICQSSSCRKISYHVQSLCPDAVGLDDCAVCTGLGAS